MNKKHWSEVLECQNCGQRFRSLSAEARHRHNYPVLCGSTKARRKKLARKAKAERLLQEEIGR